MRLGVGNLVEHRRWILAASRVQDVANRQAVRYDEDRLLRPGEDRSVRPGRTGARRKLCCHHPRPGLHAIADDEGNAYYKVLDAPGGTFASKGFNMTVHIKKPGQPWSGPITVHDNRNNPLAAQLLLDDKNWIAVDNHTDVNGGPNKPHDGKIGTLYVCWG